MRPNNKQSLAAADASTNQNGLAIDADFLLTASAQCITTGTAAGTVKFQASNDPKTSPAGATQSPTNWNDIPSATATVSASGSVLIPKIDVSYSWIRAVWTNTSGTGTVTVNIRTTGF